jgi:hypothetical protein
VSERGRHSRGGGRDLPTPPDQPATLADWGVVAALCGCAVLLAVIEVLFVPYYLGSTIFPVVVPVAVLGNVVLPRLGVDLVGRPAGGVLPFLAWLAPVLVLALTPRSEGDVIVLAVSGQEWTFYGVLVFGCVAGMITIARRSPRRAPMPRPPRRPR